MPELLTDAGRRRPDEGDDAAFYAEPRFVHHVDASFRERLCALYDAVLDPGADVLDLMASWVSHLPDAPLGRVVGLGLNAAELGANDRLDGRLVHDLNADPSLPLETDAFDAACCAVSVQYLQYPGPVFAELGRVVRPGGVCVVSFSDRLFPAKAVRAWRTRSMDERALLVSRYLDETAFDEPTVHREPARDGDPFYAAVAECRP